MRAQPLRRLLTAAARAPRPATKRVLACLEPRQPPPGCASHCSPRSASVAAARRLGRKHERLGRRAAAQHGVLARCVAVGRRDGHAALERHCSAQLAQRDARGGVLVAGRRLGDERKVAKELGGRQRAVRQEELLARCSCTRGGHAHTFDGYTVVRLKAVTRSALCKVHRVRARRGVVEEVGARHQPSAIGRGQVEGSARHHAARHHVLV